jgi:hypothetical protein
MAALLGETADHDVVSRLAPRSGSTKADHIIQPFYFHLNRTTPLEGTDLKEMWTRDSWLGVRTIRDNSRRAWIGQDDDKV